MTIVASSRALRVLFSVLLSLLMSVFATGQSFDLESDSLVIGDRYILESEPIFIFQKAELIDSTSKGLDDLASFILRFPEYQFKVQFHNDTRGSRFLSSNLSQKRAETVKAYLKEKGVPNRQLIARGMGASEPFVSDEQIAELATASEKEEAHAMNRRVQVVISAKLEP